MSFLFPEMLWLAPFLALPLLIHLLNRLRYRRVRWAAMAFLLRTERRAVRRARLRQLLLMMLRTLLLAAALGALAQPVLRGGLAGLLGRRSNAVVLLDASASMSAAHLAGDVFSTGRAEVVKVLKSLPRGSHLLARPVAGPSALSAKSLMSDPRAVATLMQSAEATEGAADLPRAIADAADVLAEAGGGGVIWLVTDGQAADWRPSESQTWDGVRAALRRAGRPRLVVSYAGSAPDANHAVTDVAFEPELPVPGETLRLRATVARHGEGEGVARLALFIEDRRVDTRSLRLSGGDRAEALFNLPPLEEHPQVGRLELGQDAVPADNVFWFVIRPAGRVPVLVADGAPSSRPFEGASDFVRTALGRSDPTSNAPALFEAETTSFPLPDELDLSGYAAVVLAEPPALAPDEADRLRTYVEEGGLVVLFPDTRAGPAFWDRMAFAGVTASEALEAEEDSPIAIAWNAPDHPVAAPLVNEGLDRIEVFRMAHLEPLSQPTPIPLLATTADAPFMLQSHCGKGRVVVFAVSARDEDSNFPLTPPFVLTLQRVLRMHVAESIAAPAYPAFAHLRLELPPGADRVVTPDGRTIPAPDSSREAFEETGRAGVYRAVRAQGGDALPVAAINVPFVESTLDRIEPQRIRALLGEMPLTLYELGEDGGRLDSAEASAGSDAAFPLALIALLFLLGEVLLGSHLSRSPSGAPAAGPSRDTGGSGRP